MQCLSENGEISVTTSCQLLEIHKREDEIRQLPVSSASYVIAAPSGDITDPEIALDTVSNAQTPTLGFCLDELEEKIRDSLLATHNQDPWRIIGYCYSDSPNQKTVIAELDCDRSGVEYSQNPLNSDISCGLNFKTPVGQTFSYTPQNLP